MNSNIQLTNQKSLIKPLTDNDKCWVYYKNNSVLTKYEFIIDGQTSIEDVILQAVNKMKNTLELSQNKSNYELYASKSNGKKINDLPSFQQKQKILKTGQRYFYLKEKNGSMKASKHASTRDTLSIPSQMNILIKHKSQIIAHKNKGCFCF